MTVLTPDAEHLLRKAGWRPGRKIDCSAMIERLQVRGFPIFPSVERFLEEFGGLVVYYYPGYREISGTSVPDDYPRAILRVMDFNLLDDASLVYAYTYEGQDMEIYREFAGQPLCPIGFDTTYYHVMQMDNAGAVYAASYGDIWELVQLGTSTVEAINRLIDGTDIWDYKYLAPFNEDELRVLFQTWKVFLSLGHNP